MGKIYDVNELDRVKNWVNMQQKSFSDSEKDKNVKEWFLLGTISIVSAVIILLIVKKRTS